ncbi:SIR2 family protein [Lentzea sp. JNUCC 0626]|uniref:SIR2 family protein n=1 Tax=Lentzea sp. JNUCC 0626 TaxID=3367513 RepID=UPI0037478EF2
MSRREKPTLIKYESFVRGHAFSFHEQPYLGELFDAIRDTRRPLTLVVGAGVSMSAGLPSWERLISNMAKSVRPENLSEMAQRDRSTPMRKAEIILNLVKASNQSKTEHEIIRDALYPSAFEINPGQLASSIARLVAARSGEVRLLTTNFDSMLEAALLAYCGSDDIDSHSLDDVDAWRASLGSKKVGVLHLHGLVPFGRKPLPRTPIILTESQFLKYGAEVRQVISENLAGAVTVFVGLSMSDPNLIGPLYESAAQKSGSARFALVVPETTPGTSYEDSAQYAIESAVYLEQHLDLKSVFLKSYSQLNQVVADLSLAVAEPARYDHGRSRRGRDSLVYGTRLAAALDRCYGSLGCTRTQQVPTGDAATDLTVRLHRALHAPKGPVALLKSLSYRYGDYRIGGADGENFALFLWLRARKTKDGRQPYALSLAGSSAYIHREEWSLRHEVPITREAPFAAAQAVFEGSPQIVDITPVPPLPIWRGIIAAPIVLAQTASTVMVGRHPADVLTVGAITLNGTRYVAGKHTNGAAPEELSLINKLDSGDFSRLLTTLTWTAQEVLALR